MRPCGLSKEHIIPIGGLDCVPDMSGALFVPAEKLLIVADLHLEQGASLARRGLYVPPFDTSATLQQLEAVVAATAPQRLVMLGDSFHDAIAHNEIEEITRSRLRSITESCETFWLSGNHDPQGPQDLGGMCVDEIALGRMLLRHIPSTIEVGCSEIAGHLHPGAGLVQRGRRIHGKCFVADDKRLIMPAFGAYTGALSLKSPAFDGMFDPANTKVWLIGRSVIHQLPFKRVS